MKIKNQTTTASGDALLGLLTTASGISTVGLEQKQVGCFNCMGQEQQQVVGQCNGILTTASSFLQLLWVLYRSNGVLQQQWVISQKQVVCFNCYG